MSGVQVDPEIQEWAQGWKEFESSLSDEASIQKEVNARGQSYLTAFKFNLTKVNEMILVALPFFLILDALMMMVIGMALYKYGILEGRREPGFYMRMVIAGFLIGLVFNAYEIWLSVSSKMDVVEANFLFRWSYHLGRLSMALGYLGLILWMIKSNWIESLRARLAAVGRMALTNYLMHSFFALLIFSGAGLGLIGKLSLVELYPIVLLIWIFQLALSPWWLERFYFGPVEWLWRWLTYLERPKMRRKDSQFIGS